jgi:hypothetical protein
MPTSHGLCAHFESTAFPRRKVLNSLIRSSSLLPHSVNMATSSAISLFLSLAILALLANHASAEEDIVEILSRKMKETPPEVTQVQRELFFSRQSDIVDCIKRETSDFSSMFDAIAYRDMILAEAGVSVEGLKEKYTWKDKKRFDETPENAAIMEVLGKRKAELEEVAQIVDACQEEVKGGRSAVGAGAMVGAIFARAMEGPIDPALTANWRQMSMTPSRAPSITPSKAPSMEPSEASAGPTQYPTYSYTTFPTFSPKRQFPIMIGVHTEFDIYILTSQGNNFLGGDSMYCVGLSLGASFGFQFGIVVVVSTWPPLEGKHDFAQMFGTDAGLIGSVGFQAGGFVEGGGFDDDYYYYGAGEQYGYGLPGGDCIGPFLFEFTIGAGLGLPSLEQSCCQFEWKN